MNTVSADLQSGVLFRAVGKGWQGLGQWIHSKGDLVYRPDLRRTCARLCRRRTEQIPIWAATANGLARLEGNRWKVVGKDWNFPGKSAMALFLDRQGTLWASSENTLVFLPSGARRFQPTGIPVGQVRQIGQAPSGKLWMSETTRSVRPIPLSDKCATASGLLFLGTREFQINPRVQSLAETNRQLKNTIIGSQDDDVSRGIQNRRANFAVFEVLLNHCARFFRQCLIEIFGDVVPDVFAI